MDIVCFSHLRWENLQQRPKELFSQATGYYRVILIESPIDGCEDDFEYIITPENVHRITPCLRSGTSLSREEQMKALIGRIFQNLMITDYVTWYYHPRYYLHTSHLFPALIIYDCMEDLTQLSSFGMKAVEAQLIEDADIIFTGGSTFEAAVNELVYGASSQYTLVADEVETSRDTWVRTFQKMHFVIQNALKSKSMHKEIVHV